MKSHSFTQYIKENLYDRLYDLSNAFLKDHHAAILREKRLRRFELSDISVLRVNIQDTDRDCICFDVVVVTELDAYHESGREDQIEVWLRVFFSMDLDRESATQFTFGQNSVNKRNVQKTGCPIN